MGELQLIEKIKKRLSRHNSSSLICGIGDDCAIFKGDNKKWLISTDTLVENKHFDLTFHAPFALGYKAFAVNLSDIAAMGGNPVFATMSFTVTEVVNDKWLDSFLDGICKIISKYNLTLIGGDTVSGSEMSMTVTILGTASHPIQRNGAGKGDAVYVSGHLGNSAGGLYLLQNAPGLIEKQLHEPWHEPLLNAHLLPEPQIELARLLAETEQVTAMQDISDGVATDLAHLVKASSVSATIIEEDLPIGPELVKLASVYRLSTTDLALLGGEDYQLLFTVNGDEKGQKALEVLVAGQGFSIKKIGFVNDGDGEVTLVKKDGGLENISFQGFEHS